MDRDITNECQECHWYHGRDSLALLVTLKHKLTLGKSLGIVVG